MPILSGEGCRVPKLNSRLYGGCHVTVVAVTCGLLANEKVGIHMKNGARVRTKNSKIRGLKKIVIDVPGLEGECVS